jgi:membrane-associated phospholipid phosphatase
MPSLIDNINIIAFKLVDSLASTQLNIIMTLATESVVIVLPLLVIWLCYKRDRNVFSFASAIVILYIIGDIIKLIVREPRPCSVTELSWINRVGCESSYSLPSDHAMVLTGSYAFLKNYEYIRLLYPIWLIIILFGRIYLGQHYLTDVIAGVLLSLIITYVIYKEREKINKAFISVFRPLR